MGDANQTERPVLVLGAPRTGTTWFASVLALADGVAWINEPDNEWPNPYALKAKLRLGHYPALLARDTAPPAYERLWDRVLSGRRDSRAQIRIALSLDRGERTKGELWRATCDHANPRVSPTLRLLTWIAAPPSVPVAGRVVLVKSVHAPLALGWIEQRFAPRVVVVRRHPLNVLASWLELGWGGSALHENPRVRERFGERWGLPQLEAGASALHEVAWEVGLFTCATHDDGAAIRPRLIAEHEAFCQGPEERFRWLYERLGWAWPAGAASFLRESNRPGAGFATTRVASEQPERWRERLSPEQVREAWSVWRRFEAPWVAHAEAMTG